MKRPLVLAYLVLGSGAFALVGVLADHDWVIDTGVGCSVLFALVHAIAFVVRARKRKTPAMLDRSGRWILGVTLGAVIGVLALNFSIAAIYVGAKGENHELEAGLAWLVIMLVLAVRAWVVPTARRAAVLQVVSIFLGIPQLVGLAILANRSAGYADPVPDTVLVVTFAVIAAAGPVLDKLYASVADRDPSPLPEAIVHH